jgi:ankyrin repeat protein
MTFDEASKIIKKGDVISLRKHLEEGLSPSLSNQYSWTLLMIAALEGNTEIGRLLIEKGADLDVRNNGRNTALSLAAHTGHPSFVKLLLESGASLQCYPFGNNIEIWLNWLGEHSACPPKELARIRELLNSERNVRTQAAASLSRLM